MLFLLFCGGLVAIVVSYIWNLLILIGALTLLKRRSCFSTEKLLGHTILVTLGGWSVDLAHLYLLFVVLPPFPINQQRLLTAGLSMLLPMGGIFLWNWLLSQTSLELPRRDAIIVGLLMGLLTAPWLILFQLRDMLPDLPFMAWEIGLLVWLSLAALLPGVVILSKRIRRGSHKVVLGLIWGLLFLALTVHQFVPLPTRPPPPGLAGKIAFVRGDRIYVMNPDGSDRQPVAQGRGPVWSPDGKRIAFYREVARREGWRKIEVYAVNVGGGDPILLGPQLDCRLTQLDSTRLPRLGWSADGKRIIVHYWSKLKYGRGLGPVSAIVDAEGRGEVAESEDTSYWLLAGWSAADGRRIISRQLKGEYRHWELTIAPKGKSPRSIRLYLGPFEPFPRRWTEPFVSPDGKQILIPFSRESMLVYDEFAYLVDLETMVSPLSIEPAAQPDLRTDAPLGGFTPWSPDGRYIVFSKRSYLWLMDVETRKLFRIGKGTEPAWWHPQWAELSQRP